MRGIQDAYKTVQWFKHISDINLNSEILVVGAGGIGSNLAFQLGRIGFNFTIYDADRVEAHNMSQMFNTNDVNKLKVTALQKTLQTYNPSVQVNSVSSMWESINGTSGIVFSCVDNMKTRRDLFHEWYNTFADKSNTVFIDARLNSEDFRIFTIYANNIKDVEDYKRNWLFNDKEASEPLCTNKQTPHIGTLCGCLMVGIFTNWLCRNDDLYRKVQFRTDFHLPLLNLS